MGSIAPSAAPIRHVRSTMLLSSRAALMSAGLFEDYEGNLDPHHRDELRNMIAGVWLPVDVALAHYGACDALHLPRTRQALLGKSNGERLNGTLLGTLAKIARSAGTTPLTLLEQFERFWYRIFDGGTITLVRRGPKDVEAIVRAAPVLGSEYFRNGLCGTAESILACVCQRVVVKVKLYETGAASATYVAQWV